MMTPALQQPIGPLFEVKGIEMTQLFTHGYLWHY